MSPQIDPWIQLSFSFAATPAIPDRRVVFIDPPVADHEKCRHAGCQKRVSTGKVYCCKGHSPFGLLEDEPDNAPPEWIPPPEESKWGRPRLYD